MKVDTQPFPSVNVVEGYDWSVRRLLDFVLSINMVGFAPRHQTKDEKADPCNRPQKGEKGYITEEQVRHVRNQKPTSSNLFKKYEYQYQQHLQCELEEEEYERRTGKRLKKQEDARDNWHFPFLRYRWDSGMSQLPTTKDCPECRPRKQDAEGVSVFRRLGPVLSQQEQIQPPRRRVDFEEEEDKYHCLCWCPDGLNHS
jgi:hypothetical protein